MIFCFLSARLFWLLNTSACKYPLVHGLLFIPRLTRLTHRGKLVRAALEGILYFGGKRRKAWRRRSVSVCCMEERKAIGSGRRGGGWTLERAQCCTLPVLADSIQCLHCIVLACCSDMRKLELMSKHPVHNAVYAQPCDLVVLRVTCLLSKLPFVHYPGFKLFPIQVQWPYPDMFYRSNRK